MSNHIFLFILDAVRKDHLSLYGYPRKTSPNIDKLAKQADVYNLINQFNYQKINS